MNNSLSFYINGEKVTVESPDPETSLLEFLRNNYRLPGTKFGCGEGGCGSCTVVISRLDAKKRQQPIHYAVTSCLVPLCSLHGQSVTTVEGIGSTKTQLHALQERLAKGHGTQCGYCSPGMVMSMYALIRNNQHISERQIEEAIQGNLCRCTGYRPILDAFKTFACKGNCVGCQNGCQNKSEERQTGQSTLNEIEDLVPYYPMQEPTLPLKLSNIDQRTLLFKGSRTVWIRPATLQELLQMKKQIPGLTLVAGNTQIGLKWRLENQVFPMQVSLIHLEELKEIKEDPDKGLWVGSSVTISELEAYLEQMLTSQKNSKTRVFHCIMEMLKTYTGKQVKNSASARRIEEESVENEPSATTAEQLPSTLEPELLIMARLEEPSRANYFKPMTVENVQPSTSKQVQSTTDENVQLLTADPIYPMTDERTVGGTIVAGIPTSDLNPVLLASQCSIEVIAAGNEAIQRTRTIELDENFFAKGPKKMLKPEEIVYSLLIPYSKNNEFLSVFKSNRRQTVVNAAMRVQLKIPTNEIVEGKLAFGGITSYTMATSNIFKLLKGKRWGNDFLTEAQELLAEEMTKFQLSEYQSRLVNSFFLKYYLTVFTAIEGTTNHPTSLSMLSPRGTTFSSQVFQQVDSSQPLDDTVGRPVAHQSAEYHVTGEAVYCDDIPKIEGELFMAPVTSEKAHALIKSIDSSKALAQDGVRLFLSAQDIPQDKNVFGIFQKEEDIFVKEKVMFKGQLIGAIIADSKALALRAAKLVHIEYQDINPIILTIEEAIAAQSFLGEPRILENGDVKEGMKNSDHVISGEIRLGGQRHFYLETHSMLVVPKSEQNEIEIFIGCQDPHSIQLNIARVLGIASNRVVCRVKRLGGGFGGKGTRNVPLAIGASLAAKKLGLPVRCVLERQEDMRTMGGRNPCLSKYKVGVNKDGSIQALELDFYMNAGNSVDLSAVVLDLAIGSADNCYCFPAVKLTGRLCQTNIASNTSFRGFGVPQGVMTTETMMDHVAHELKLDPVKVRELNMYRENGDMTPYQQKVINSTIRRCWTECIKSSNYQQRKENIDEFNRTNKGVKRGIALMPIKFGMGFGVPFMNQGSALVHVYTDGAVLLTTGGTEMGQGLNTKMIQVASRVLQIPSSKIHINEMCTDKIANASPTSASTSTEIFGAAVVSACQTILNRLKPFVDSNPNGLWEDWVNAAYFSRVSLSATGFHVIPDLNYDFMANKGHRFNYFSYGAACSEVEIDCLTGDHRFLRTDILMDLGKSLNPAVDIGQIEGAFIQGYGYMIMEDLRYAPDGNLITRGPLTYKIPTCTDIPENFYISLLKESSNPRAVYSSKSTGEPPLCLAGSVYFAIKNAIRAHHLDAQKKKNFQLNIPATAERIALACQ